MVVSNPSRNPPSCRRRPGCGAGQHVAVSECGLTSILILLPPPYITLTSSHLPSARGGEVLPAGGLTSRGPPNAIPGVGRSLRTGHGLCQVSRTPGLALPSCLQPRRASVDSSPRRMPGRVPRCPESGRGALATLHGHLLTHACPRGWGVCLAPLATGLTLSLSWWNLPLCWGLWGAERPHCTAPSSAVAPSSGFLQRSRQVPAIFAP